MHLQYRVLCGDSVSYRRVKRMLDKGKHPAFIGRDMFSRCAVNGGVILARLDERDVAVAIVNPRLNILLALNVLPEFRNRSIGKMFVSFLKCNWARVIESSVPWFEGQGYVKVGSPKKGRAITTFVMIKKNIITMGDRLRGLTRPDIVIG